MEKLHDISKKPGITLKRIESEPWKLPPLSCEHNKAMVRTRQQQKLLFENERICKRLLSIQTTFNRAKDEKEYKRHREAVQDMSKVPPPGGAPPKPQRPKKRGMKLPPLTDIDEQSCTFIPVGSIANEASGRLIASKSAPCLTESRQKRGHRAKLAEGFEPIADGTISPTWSPLAPVHENDAATTTADVEDPGPLWRSWMKDHPDAKASQSGDLNAQRSMPVDMLVLSPLSGIAEDTSDSPAPLEAEASSACALDYSQVIAASPERSPPLVDTATALDCTGAITPMSPSVRLCSAPVAGIDGEDFAQCSRSSWRSWDGGMRVHSPEHMQSVGSEVGDELVGDLAKRIADFQITMSEFMSSSTSLPSMPAERSLSNTLHTCASAYTVCDGDDDLSGEIGLDLAISYSGTVGLNAN
jgi:hypothetical protein